MIEMSTVVPLLLLMYSCAPASAYNVLLRPNQAKSTFLGQDARFILPEIDPENNSIPTHPFLSKCLLVMRKQKASDKRTRRRQQASDVEEKQALRSTLTQSPMQQRGRWNDKQNSYASALSRPPSSSSMVTPAPGGGRGRSRKRSILYNSLSFYHDKFLALLTEEYKAEVKRPNIMLACGAVRIPVRVRIVNFVLMLHLYPCYTKRKMKW